MKKITMTVPIDEELTELAQILAHENDTFSLKLYEQLPSEDYETLQRAAQICYRLARIGVPEIPEV